MEWKPIDTAPTHGNQILVGFQGQYRWYSFVAIAHGKKTHQTGFAKPTHWTEIFPPNLENQPN